MSTVTETVLGANSEVGRLHTVMVHRPDLAHERLSPSNSHELLFDDVIWVRRARQEFDAFVDLMREYGVEVLLFHDLLTATLEDAEARSWLLSRRLRPEEVTEMFCAELTAWMTEMPADELAVRLTGGVTTQDLPDSVRTVIGRALAPTDFVLPPLPNHLFTRDTSAWIYGGVSLNTMYWPARQLETLNVEAVYRFHPRFRDADFQIWFGGADHDWGTARIEGGDIVPVGDGVVVVGHSERSTAKATSILAKNLFNAGAARLVTARAGGDAPRHRLHAVRPERLHAVHRSWRRSCPSSTRRTATAASMRSCPSARSSRRCRTRSGSRSSWSCRPPATSSRPSARSGTTATTSSRSRRV
jgi:arginine deiminase